MSSDLGERRLAPVYLFLSALAFAGIAYQEGYSDKAVRPLPGDKPTYGLGSTVRPDGKPVQEGDRITPPAAINLAVRDITAKEAEIKACVTAPMHQHEYDAFVSLAYNVGPVAVAGSALVRMLNAGNIDDAAERFLQWSKVRNPKTGMLEPSPGLLARRRAERTIFLGGLYNWDH